MVQSALKVCVQCIQCIVYICVVPSVYLLFSASGSIRRVSQDTPGFVDVCVISNLKDIKYITHYNGTILWSDANGVMYNIEGITNKLVSVKKPQGLTVDYTTGNIYFIDGTGPNIELVTNNGLYRKILINSTHLINPTSIAIHPSKG